MKSKLILALAFGFAMPLMAQTEGRSKVYFTSDITPAGLVKVYEALGVPAEGRVAVKISTGESEKSHQLNPQLIADLVKKVNGTLVECNTAYPGNRSNTAAHRRAIAERGYDKIAPVDIMDAEYDIDIPVQDTTYIKFDRVGKNLENYDFMINLAHFKGHAMGGFGGVIKNASIGVASADGKAYIHSCGTSTNVRAAFQNKKGQDAFLESMAAAAQGVHNYMKGKVLYIDVMNNMSVDCDCDGDPDAPKLKDMGILASLDPVALDKACIDLVFTHNATPGDDNDPLIARVNRQHGTHILDYGEKIGFGSKGYELIDITDCTAPEADKKGKRLYNVYGMDGGKVLSKADSLKDLVKGEYIVNGKAQKVK